MIEYNQIPIQTHDYFAVADSIAPLSHIKKNGYYSVGGKIFAHKFFALQEATRTKQEPKFHFCDQEFSKVDWRTATTVPLTDLYRLRAQQLREKYDYIICNFSGGADSSTIIDSFVNNGIRLDEILVSWPLRYLHKKFPISRSIAAENLMSEWDLAIEPKLQQISKDHPNIKITIADYSDDLGTDEYAEDSLIYTAKCGYVAIKKHRAKDRVMRERQQKYKNIVALTGVNPVSVQFYDDWLAVIFFDEACNGYRSEYMPGGYIRNVEFFYWTADFPEIIKAQAHLYLKYFNSHPEDINIMPRFHLAKDGKFVFVPGDPEKERQLAKKLFYHNWNHNTFQANKPKIWTAQCEWYSWYYNNPHSTDSMQSWQSMIDNHIKMVDTKLLHYENDTMTRFVSIFSHKYIVGKLQPTG
jgi:hypothetical protein